MREDRAENSDDDSEDDDDSPKAKYICRIEAAILDHLKDPDQIESQNQCEIN